MKTLIISPHLDDALFSLSSLLMAGGNFVIATVFTQECQFEHLTGDYAAYGDMKTRKKEDIAAITFLNQIPGTKVQYIHLDYPDTLFRKGNNAPFILPLIDAMRELCTRKFDKIYCPLGVGEHPDHVFVYDICQNVFGNNAIYYCEFPYSALKLNQVKRFNRLGLDHGLDLDLDWSDYVDYYTHPIYASTLGVLRFFRLFRKFRCLTPAVNSVRQESHEIDVEFKYALLSHYKTQIDPIFGSLERLKKELQKEQKETLVHFIS